MTFKKTMNILWYGITCALVYLLIVELLTASKDTLCPLLLALVIAVFTTIALIEE